ncbi:helix-turn-helix domain-containing protein [Streptomyces cyaneofuscatus]|uniref:helix-turn-helix domain-containing protein n=1 Tax=Streptomyces cyaneofuscatus TaxID=66883 RepID=UPI003865CEBE|nr:helix-turn-helix domain-containing protein [Streptomyces cyaneofuscatus]
MTDPLLTEEHRPEMAPEPATAAERVAANVKLLRTRRGWTQAEMARQAGVSENRVWGLEVGKRRVTVNDLARFAEVFGVTPERMLSDDPEPNGPELDECKPEEPEPEGIADSDPIYEVTVDGGHTQSFAADTVDPGETWASFYLRETRVFLAPTARILGIRLITEEAPDA